jgi:hypothetical protein
MEERIKELTELGYKTDKEISWEQLHLYYLTKMKEVLDNYNGDEEGDHTNVDKLLCELLEILGFKELIDTYGKIKKWYA